MNVEKMILTETWGGELPAPSMQGCVWIDVDGERARLDIWSDKTSYASSAYFSPEKLDELIRALGLARVELSKARPQS